MIRILRRLMPVVLALSVGAVALAASPASAAVSCSPQGGRSCLANNSPLAVYWGDGWCWSSLHYEEITETYNCTDGGAKYVEYAQGTSDPAFDVDTVRYDANCITTVNGLRYDLRGQVSRWRHYNAGTTINVTEKTCYGPSNLRQTGFGPNRISIGWNAIPSDFDDPASPITYKVYRNGTLVATLGRTHNYFDDTGLASNTTYRYDVTMKRTYLESLKSTVNASTTAPAPPTYPPETAPPYLPTVSYSNLYYVTTFGSAPGKVGATTVGYLYASSSNYVFCKAEWGVTTGPYGHNKYWMFTDLDSGGYNGTGRGWVSAYYLSNYGNDEVYANGGGEIPYC